MSLAMVAACVAAGPARADVAGADGPLESCAQLALPGPVGPPYSLYSAPNPGGGLGALAVADETTSTRLPRHVDLRTESQGFNDEWAYALDGGNLYVTTAAGDSPWRKAWLPACLAGKLTALSVDGNMLMATDATGRIYTMGNAAHDPETWAWTSRFGAPVWFGPFGQRVRTGSRAWSLSWLDNRIPSLIPANRPGFWDQGGFWNDSADNRQPVGGAGVTTVYVLSPQGNRIAILDPWLPGGDLTAPDDYSYELSGPRNGRFEAVNLSAAGSTTFVINRYGDMYTRLWDFDISGADNVFFRYSYGDQRGKPVAPNVNMAVLDNLVGPHDYAAYQLPAPDWVRQPKIPGEITSAISIHQTGGDTADRELRVEGRSGGRNGYWHKPIDPAASWRFEATDTDLTADTIDNPAGDHSDETLAPPSGIDYTYTDPAQWTLRVNDFDYAASPAPLTLCAGDDCVDLRLRLVDSLRTFRAADGLTGTPREYLGAIEVPQEVLDALPGKPTALATAIGTLTGTTTLRELEASATLGDLTLQLPTGPLVLRRT
ncbi:hypothetical protein VMT65_05755 [Nocardia sp. CDC153]|uniref:hypothetical protein n=1 Tax=Nocardia sp. CDC153 TaxID=3112167 RepID=UPI002DBFC8D7|nr:hypothetical protein [Nocardia sp. CDC153]MEC3952530.1 hypothetical protein [Nocardia sp. CDC153]